MAVFSSIFWLQFLTFSCQRILSALSGVGALNLLGLWQPNFRFLQALSSPDEIPAAQVKAQNVKPHYNEGYHVTGDHIAGGIGGGFLKKHIDLRLHTNFQFQLLDLILQVCRGGCGSRTGR